MNASDALREALADRYGTHLDWKRAATRAGLDPSHIALEGSSFVVWTNILEAVQTGNRLEGLRELVATQQSDLLPLLEQYATDVARGGGELTNLPELAAVVLKDADLDTSQVVLSLAFEEALRGGLVALALAQKVPSTEALDAALNGARTARAKAHFVRYLDQQEQALAPLERRRATVRATAEALKQKIANTERARPPSPPIAPKLSELQPLHQDYLRSQHAENLKIYNAALSRYQTEQNALAGVRADAQAADQEIAQLDATIASNRAQAAAGEPPFRRAIEDARDQDLVLELDRMLEQASKAFRGEANPFRGFWILLASCCLLDLIEKLVSNAASATEARQRFASEASSLTSLIQSGLPSIVRGCLAGPTVVARALAANRAVVDATRGRLGELPSDALRGGTRRARAAIAAPPEIPAYVHLELPADIEVMARQLKELRTSISLQVKRLQAELADDLRREVRRALDDAAMNINAIRITGENQSGVLARTRTLWNLVDRGAASADLPAPARTLCAALPHEFASREEIKPNALFSTVSNTSFALTEAQALVDAPALANYVKSGVELQHNLTASERRGADVDAALSDLTDQIGKVVNRYRNKLRCIEGLAAVPVLGILLAIWGLSIVGCLRPLVASGEARYIELGRNDRGATCDPRKG